MKRFILSILAVFIITCLFGCSQKLETRERLGEEVYVFENFEIPSALGKPRLKVDELKEKAKYKLESVADQINTYAEALVLMFNRPAQNIENEQFIRNLITLLKDDYEDVEVITFYKGMKYNNPVSYFDLCIKANGRYYLLDPVAYKLSNQWLEDYNLEKGSFDTKEELIEAAKNGYPSTYINAYYAPKDLSGNPLTITFTEYEDIYEYNSYDFLVDYGFPTLTEAEISQLIKDADNGNYDAVKSKISNIPDAVIFLKKYGFKSTGMNNLVKTSEYDGPDVGNIFYHDDVFAYTVSGVESLIIKEGQCTSTSTLFKYLLDDDYEEFGYVEMWCRSNESPDGFDGHAINYFKDNGKYYLVSPSYYLAGDGAWKTNKKLWYGSDTAGEMMQKLYDSSYPIGKQAMSIAFAYDGVYCTGTLNGRGENCTVIVPTGSEVKACLGRTYDYAEPKHSTSQDTILGVKIKN